MLQRRRDPVRAGRRPCSALLAPFGRDRALEYTLQGLEDVQMDPVERPAAAADPPVACVSSPRSEIVRSTGRFSCSANPTEYTTRPASSGSRDGGFSPYGSGSAVDPKTGPRQFEKSSIRWPARREPGRRPRAYISNPWSSRARPTQARYGRLFSRNRPDKSKTVRLLALSSPARQHPGPPDVPAARKSGTSSPPGGVAAGNLLAARLGSRGGNKRPGRIRSGPREAENL